MVEAKAVKSQIPTGKTYRAPGKSAERDILSGNTDAIAILANKATSDSKLKDGLIRSALKLDGTAMLKALDEAGLLEGPSGIELPDSAVSMFKAAVVKGHTASVKYLLDRGLVLASPRMIHRDYSMTYCDYAIQADQADMLELLYRYYRSRDLAADLVPLCEEERERERKLKIRIEEYCRDKDKGEYDRLIKNMRNSDNIVPIFIRHATNRSELLYNSVKNTAVNCVGRLLEMGASPFKSPGPSEQAPLKYRMQPLFYAFYRYGICKITEERFKMADGPFGKETAKAKAMVDAMVDKLSPAARGKHLNAISSKTLNASLGFINITGKYYIIKDIMSRGVDVIKNMKAGASDIRQSLERDLKDRADISDNELNMEKSHLELLVRLIIAGNALQSSETYAIDPWLAAYMDEC